MKAIRSHANPAAPVHRLAAFAALAAVAMVAQGAEEQPAGPVTAVQQPTDEQAIAALFPAEQGTAAVWKRKEVDFLYRSSLALYSCGALKDRVASIMRAIGARQDVQVRVDNCREVIPPLEEPMSRWEGPSSSDILDNRRRAMEQITHVRVSAYMPTELTPEVLKEIDKDRSRRELISRVTGDPAARSNDPVVFPAKVQSVTLSRKTVGFEPVECELVDQISTALKRIDVRVVQRSANCDRRNLSRIPPQLTVEALMGVQFDARLPEMPPEEEGETDDVAESPASEPAQLSPIETSS